MMKNIFSVKRKQIGMIWGAWLLFNLSMFIVANTKSPGEKIESFYPYYCDMVANWLRTYGAIELIGFGFIFPLMMIGLYYLLLKAEPCRNKKRFLIAFKIIIIYCFGIMLVGLVGNIDYILFYLSLFRFIIQSMAIIYIADDFFKLIIKEK